MNLGHSPGQSASEQAWAPSLRARTFRGSHSQRLAQARDPPIKSDTLLKHNRPESALCCEINDIACKQFMVVWAARFFVYFLTLVSLVAGVSLAGLLLVVRFETQCVGSRFLPPRKIYICLEGHKLEGCSIPMAAQAWAIGPAIGPAIGKTTDRGGGREIRRKILTTCKTKEEKGSTESYEWRSSLSLFLVPRPVYYEGRREHGRKGHKGLGTPKTARSGRAIRERERTACVRHLKCHDRTNRLRGEKGGTCHTHTHTHTNGRGP